MMESLESDGSAHAVIARKVAKSRKSRKSKRLVERVVSSPEMEAIFQRVLHSPTETGSGPNLDIESDEASESVKMGEAATDGSDKENVEVAAVQLVQRLAAVDGRGDLKSEFLQIGRQNLANDVRIVDYERVHANLRQMAAVAASGSPLRANLNTATIL